MGSAAVMRMMQEAVVSGCAALPCSVLLLASRVDHMAQPLLAWVATAVDIDAQLCRSDAAGNPGVHRTTTAPPFALLAAARPSAATVGRRATDPVEAAGVASDGSGSSSSTPPTAAGAGLAVSEASLDHRAGPAPTPGAGMQLPACLPASPGRGDQQGPALSAVIAQLQEEVALAESRRHDAEVAAQQAQQTAADLRRQLDKVQRQVAAKRALLAELEARLEATTEAEGEAAARQMAAEAEEARLERQRRQLGAADTLIQRLMDAVGAATGRRATASSATSSGMSVGSGAGSTSSRGADAASAASSQPPASPQSSCGSKCSAPPRAGSPLSLS